MDSSVVEIMGRYRIIDLLSTQLATDEAQNKVIAQQAYDSSRTLDLPADRRDLASCSSFCMGAILESSFSARAFEVLGKQRRLPVLARQLCRGQRELDHPGFPANHWLHEICQRKFGLASVC